MLRCLICNNFILEEELYVDPDTGDLEEICEDCNLPAPKFYLDEEYDDYLDGEDDYE